MQEDLTAQYMDDEPIVPMVQRNTSEKLESSIRCGLTSIRVSASRSEENVPCVVTLQGCSSGSGRLYSIDIVCAIDVSGSMREMGRVPPMQATLKQLVDTLEGQDRVSIVTFSDQAERKCPLTACTTAGKNLLRGVIDSLKVEDLTNISAGLLQALQVLSARRVVNTQAVILLFTDGKHTCGDLALDECQRALAETPNLSVHCFGLGDELDTKLLEYLSLHGNGEFHHISSLENIDKEFSLAFANIATVVARNISITLELVAIARDTPSDKVPFQISRIYSKDGEQRFFLNAISAHMSKHCVFVVRPECVELSRPIRQVIVTAHTTYDDLEGLNSTSDSQAEVRLLPWGDVEPVQNTTVFTNWYRMKGVCALAEARRHAEEGEFTAADNRLQYCIEDLSSSTYRNQPIVSQMLQDLDKLKSLLQSPHAWKDGEATFAAISYSHSEQRGSVHTVQYLNENQKSLASMMRSCSH